MFKVKIILLLLIGLLSGCFDDGDCTSTKTDLLQISFKDFDTKKDSLVNIQSIVLTGSDEVFNVKDTTRSIALPLNPNTSSMTINFTIDIDEHELILDYTVVPRLISPDCGVETSFLNVTVDDDKYSFDSVAVANSQLDEEIIQNIVIYH